MDITLLMLVVVVVVGGGGGGGGGGCGGGGGGCLFITAVSLKIPLLVNSRSSKCCGMQSQVFAPVCEEPR